MSPTPRPSPLTGTEPLTWWTLTRLLSWILRWRTSRTSTRWLLAGLVAVATTATFIYLSVHGVQLATAALVSGGIVLGATTAGVVGAPTLIAAGTLAWARLGPGWTVGYFDNTAGLIVRPDGSGVWKMSDHVGRRPGHGGAAGFRRRVFVHLAEEADRSHVRIVTNTRVEKLVDRYIEDLPGLRVVGRPRTWTGDVWHLEREPKGSMT